MWALGGSLFTLLFAGAPIGIALAGATALLVLFDDFLTYSTLFEAFFSFLTKYTLVAIPFFIYAGFLMEKTGLVASLFKFADALVGWVPGGFAYATLLSAVLFGAISGSSTAMAAAMSVIAYPELVKRGYPVWMAAGVIASAGGIALLIPPSIMLIVYSVIAQLSPLRLFAAAIFPGLMLAGLYIGYAVFRAWLNPSIAPKPAAEEIPPTSVIMKEVLVSFLPLFSLIILVLGTILAGIATPAEAAAVGAFGALVLSYFYKTLKWKNFKESVFLTAKTTAMIMWLFIGSWTFASVFSYLGGHEVFEHFFKSLDLQPWQFLVITQIIIFLLGWPLEWTEILIIFVPIFLPLVEFFGVNPYFFAMLIALNLQTSFLTPPMAMSAYYLKGVQSRNVELMEIFRGIMPFLAIVILAMVLMYWFPGIALWLPETLFAN